MMPPPQPTAPSRQVLCVDLGPLRARLDAAAAAEDIKPSAWLKRALRSALDAADGGVAVAATSAGGAAGRTRVLLSSAAVKQLDERCKAEGFRSRDDALVALLGGAMGRMAPASQGGNAPRKGERGPGVAAAGAALITSNAELVSVGRSLNQLAKAVDAGGDVAGMSRELLDAVRLVRLHVKTASMAAAEISNLVRIQSEARK